MQGSSEQSSGASGVDIPTLSSTPLSQPSLQPMPSPDPLPGGGQRKPVVAIVATSTVCGMTQNKWLALVPMFQSAGYEALALVWDSGVAETASARQIPMLRAVMQETAFDKLAEAKSLHALLNRPIISGLTFKPYDWPTWGDLLAFDDFIGASQWLQVSGLGAFRPDLFVTPFPGAESSTNEDEQMMLAVSRYARTIHAPLLALETQRLNCDLDISRTPVDCLLTKCAYPADVLAPLAGATFKLPPAWRHVCSGGPDPDLEDFLQKEAGHRQQLNWEPGRSYVFLPFHVYYMEECARILAALGKLTELLERRNIEILVGCGFAHRRNLTEKDLILEGLKRWIQGIPKWSILEGGNTLGWALLSEVTLLPYPSSGIEDAARRWGLPLIRDAAAISSYLVNLEPAVSPLSAAAWLLSPGRAAAYTAALKESHRGQ